MKIIWSVRAIDRAAEEASFIARDKPEAARRWLEEVRRLERFPKSGTIVPELGSPRYRPIVYKGHRVIYRVEEKRVVILTVRRFKKRMDPSELAES